MFHIFSDDAYLLMGLDIEDLYPEPPVLSHMKGRQLFPPCLETATWILMNKPIYISQIEVKCWNSLKLGVLRSGFLRPITDCRSQKAVPADPITIPIFLKPSFYYVELFIVILQSGFLDIYSGPEFHFWEWISPLGDSCERGFFNLRGGGGIF